MKAGLLAPLAGSFALAACAPDALAPSRYLVYDRTGDGYRLVEVTIPTLDEPYVGRGQRAVILGDGVIQAETAEPKTEEDWVALLRIEDAEPPHVQLDVRPDGLAVPWDLDSALMITLYHHLEVAGDHFARLGFAGVGQRPVYYHPRLPALLGLPLPLLSDNAAYAPTLDAFLVLPEAVLGGVPLSANPGVITHELSHAVFARLVYPGRRAPPYLLEDWPALAANELRSVDEGFADLFAALALGEPNFITPSLGEDGPVLDRDLSRERTYTAAMQADAAQAELGQYDPYPLGSVVASTIWTLRARVSDVELGTAAVEALAHLASPGPEFRVARAFDAVVAALPAEHRAAACARFDQALGGAAALTCSF